MTKYATPKLENDFRASLLDSKYAYSRARPICGSLSIFVYHNDEKSPTGVKLAASFPDFEDGVKIMDEVGRPFPLSPTEGLHSAG